MKSIKVISIAVMSVIMICMPACHRNFTDEALQEKITQKIKVNTLEKKIARLAELSDEDEEDSDSVFNAEFVSAVPVEDNDSTYEAANDSTSEFYDNIFSNSDTDDDDGFIAVGIFALAVLMIIFVVPIVIPIAIVFLICYFIYKSKRNRNEVIKAALESGQTLPAEFYAKNLIGSRLQSGFTYIAWGVGIIAIFAWSSNALACLGIIPTIIGIGKLVAYYIYDYKNKVRKEEQENIESTDDVK